METLWMAVNGIMKDNNVIQFNASLFFKEKFGLLFTWLMRSFIGWELFKTIIDYIKRIWMTVMEIYLDNSMVTFHCEICY